MWCVKDDYGRGLVFMVYLLISSATLFSIAVVMLPLLTQHFWCGLIIAVFYVLVVILSVASHFKCMTTQPGYTQSRKEELYLNLLDYYEQPAQSNFLTCSICGTKKVPRMHHCTICNCCIINMDHHCPWVNNCVGFYTQKHFLLFLIYTILLITFTATLFTWKFLHCYLDIESDLCFIERYNPSVFYYFEFLICSLGLVFGAFCGKMLIDQLDCIVNNITVIDQLQNKHFKKVIYT
jgi:hypothetical protein